MSEAKLEDEKEAEEINYDWGEDLVKMGWPLT